MLFGDALYFTAVGCLAYLQIARNQFFQEAVSSVSSAFLKGGEDDR